MKIELQVGRLYIFETIDNFKCARNIIRKEQEITIRTLYPKKTLLLPCIEYCDTLFCITTCLNYFDCTLYWKRRSFVSDFFKS